MCIGILMRRRRSIGILIAHKTGQMKARLTTGALPTAVFLIALLSSGAGCAEPPAATATATAAATVRPVTLTVNPRHTLPLRDDDFMTTAVIPSQTPTVPPTATAVPSRTAIPSVTPTPAFPPATATSLPVSGTLAFELVQHAGGRLQSMALAGDILFAGQGPRLIALRVDNPAQPQLLGQSAPLPGLVHAVLVREQTAYLSAGRYLMLLDVSDPAHMRERARLELPAAGAILLREDIIYAAGLVSRHYEFRDGRDINTYQSYLAAVDVAGAPRLLDVHLIPYPISAIALNDPVLYIGLPEPGQPLLALDVSDPAAIGNLTMLPLPVEVAYTLRVYGDTLIVGGYYELAAFDVREPLQPQHLWREEGSDLGTVYDFAVAGGQLHTVGWQAAGGYIPAQTAVTLPEPLPEPAYLSPTGQAGIVALGEHLYIIHPSWAADSTLGDYHPLTGGPLAVHGDVLYVAHADHQNGRVDSYRLPELAPLATFLFEPVEEESSRAIYGLTVADDRLYLSGWKEVQIVDATGFTLLGHLGAPLLPSYEGWRGVSLPVVGDMAIISTGGTSDRDGLIRFDVGDPANPRQLGTIRLNPHLRVSELAATEKWLAVSLYSTEVDGQDYLAFYDMQGEAPQLIANIAVMQAPSALQFSDDLLLAGGDSLSLYRLPEPALLAELPMPGVFAMHIVDQIALISLRQDNRLLAVDISDPAAPQVAGAFDLAAGESYLATAGDTIIAGSESMGLYLLQIQR